MKLDGIILEGESVWEISGGYDLPKVLHALSALVPPDSVLYLEGGCIADEVGDFLAARPAPSTTKVYPGTIAPRPAIFHMPATQENLRTLASICERFAENEVCDHLHVYRDQKKLMAGYDFGDLSLLLSESFTDSEVAAFASKIGCSYAKRKRDT